MYLPGFYIPTYRLQAHLWRLSIERAAAQNRSGRNRATCRYETRFIIQYM